MIKNIKPNIMSLFQLESFVIQAKTVEKTFPTVLELLKILREELNENDFNLLKMQMIQALYLRFEVKIGFLNEFETHKIKNTQQLTPEEITKELYTKFRVYTSRVNTQKLFKNSESQMEEFLKICGDSFTLRDLRARFISENGEVNTNNNGYNTVQYCIELDKLALQFNSIPYED